MASLVPNENVRESVYRRIEFDPPMGGRRQKIHLGSMSAREAIEIKRRVEEIIQDLRLGNPHMGGLIDWMKRLPADFQLKLQKKGLMKASRVASLKLKDFLADLFVFYSKSAKPATLTNYGNAQRNLLEHFGPNKLVAEFTSEDGHEFKAYLQSLQLPNGNKRLAKATIGRRVKLARQFFHVAVRKKFIEENPFTGVKGGGQRNADRLVFVEPSWVDGVIKTCGSRDWKVLIALGRYGGLRIPSEMRGLEWRHIDFENDKMLVHSPKTEHHEGKETRWVPLFDELKKVLLPAFKAARRDAVYVIRNPKLRKSTNLRTTFCRLIELSGRDPWIKPWQNMRSTRETELIERLGLKDACAIIGNTEKVALEHYLQLRPQYMESAIVKDRAARKAEKAAEAKHAKSAIQANLALGSELTSTAHAAIADSPEFADQLLQLLQSAGFTAGEEQLSNLGTTAHRTAHSLQETAGIEGTAAEDDFDEDDVSAVLFRYLQLAANYFQNKKLQQMGAEGFEPTKA